MSNMQQHSRLDGTAPHVGLGATHGGGALRTAPLTYLKRSREKRIIRREKYGTPRIASAIHTRPPPTSLSPLYFPVSGSCPLAV